MARSIQEKMFEGITRWQRSGLTQKAWCAKHDIAYSVFHYWYRRFRSQHATTDQSDEGFVQLLVPDPPSGGAWCELVLGEGKKLFFHRPVSAAFIKSLLA